MKHHWVKITIIEVKISKISLFYNLKSSNIIWCRFLSKILSFLIVNIINHNRVIWIIRIESDSEIQFFFENRKNFPKKKNFILKSIWIENKWIWLTEILSGKICRFTLFDIRIIFFHWYDEYRVKLMIIKWTIFSPSIQKLFTRYSNDIV